MDRTSSGKPPARRRPLPRRLQWTRPLLLRALAASAAAAVLIWLSLAITLTSLTARNRPSIASAWWPWSAVANASLAEALIADGRPSARDLTQAQALAEDALRREPVNAVAARMLGVVAALRRQEGPAERALNYAETLSKRDLPTQLILIEREVARNDIPGALRHYHRALSTSRRSAETLLPILVQASSDPNIARPLASTLARRPPWWFAFTERLVAEGRSPQTLGLILSALRLDVNHEGERPLLVSGMTRMATLGGVRQAYEVDRAARRGGDRSTQLLRNGSFETDRNVPPFDWSMASDSGLAAFREVLDAGRQDHALFLVAEPGRAGEVARQLVMLPRGRYRLLFSAGAVVGERISRPEVVVTCLSSDRPALLTIRVPEAPAAGISLRGDFDVPAAACDGQWLSIRAGSGIDQQNMPWLDQFEIRPR